MTVSGTLPRASLTASAIAVAILLLAIAGPATPQTRPELAPVPKPDLSNMEGSVRAQLEELHDSVESAAAGQIEASQLAEGYGTLGQYYLAHELLDPAAASFRNAAALAPDDPRWPYLLGIVLQTRGELPAALASFRRVLELRPDDLPSLVRAGNTSLDLDDLEGARELFGHALELDADSAAAHYGLGRTAAQDDAEAAVRHFERTLELQPEASIVHYPLGQAYRKLGDLERAREHLKQRGRDEVTFPDPLGNQVAWLTTRSAFEVVQELAYEEEGFSERDFLGFVLSQLGDVDGAVEQLEEALRIKTEELEAGAAELAPEEAARERRAHARIHYALGGLLVKRHSDQEASRHFTAALELEPDMEDARIKLGNVLARAKDFDAARREYTRVLERYPESVPALVKRAAVLMELAEPRAAATDLERALELDASSSEARFRLARCYEELDDVEAARAHYQAALELDLTVPEQALARLHLGNLTLAGGDVEGALELYRATVELEPETTEPRFRLATTLGRAGRYAESAAAYGELLAIEPEHVQARLGRATALLLLGEERQAASCLEEGLSLKPDSLELAHALARLLATAAEPELRNGDRAVELAVAVVRTAPTLDHVETLGMALAEAGRFDEAIQVQRNLLDQAQQRGDSGALPRLRRHLELYEAGSSCCGG